MLPLSELIIASYDFGSYYAIPIDYYPSGEPIITTAVIEDATKTALGDPRYWNILLRPKSMNAFVAAMFLCDALADKTHQPLGNLILPMAPGARQDRRNPAGDYLFTAKSVANMINARGFAKVTLIDPHSDVMPALIDHCEVITAGDIFYKMISTEYWSGLKYGYDGIISPDGGAEKRAMSVAKVMGLPLYHAWKTRDVTNGNITGFGVEQLEWNKKYLVVDDICDGGRTFLGLKQQLDEFYATADLYVTHGIFSYGTQELLENYKYIYTTDSIPGYDNGVSYFDVCERLITLQWTR